jgi:methylenetetrahydrofolate reductase (NADPH)
MLDNHAATFSFEFFPPKTDEAVPQLMERATQLAQLRPAFVSVTYGAGGSTRDRTRDVVIRLKNEMGLNVAAHLTCVGHSRDELIDILELYRRSGVQNIVALRGDAPQADVGFKAHPSGFKHAHELVGLIREKFGDHFGIAVAGYPEGHPETPSRITDLDRLKAKVDAGAHVVVTQLFFDNRDFYDFRERCELVGIDKPIVAGIMPILSRKGVERMAGMCGANIPAKLLRRLRRAGDDEEQMAQIGIDWATQQCRDLLDNQVRGIHFYTLNRSTATSEIYRRLGATDSQALQKMAKA